MLRKLAIIFGFVWKNGFGANGGTFEQELQGMSKIP
jgi:hypothetical protein